MARQTVVALLYNDVPTSEEKTLPVDLSPEALGFTPYSGQPNKGLAETLIGAGFAKAHVVKTSKAFCALAMRP